MPDPVADHDHDREGVPADGAEGAAETHDDARAAANLTKDVAKWSVDRHTRERIEEEEFAQPVIQPPPPPRVRAKPKAPAAVPAPVKPAGEKKPFSMSFGGVSNEDYIASLRAKGRR